MTILEMQNIHPLISELVSDIELTGHIPEDAVRFLNHHDCPRTAIHSGEVSTEARRIAALAHANPWFAELAGWLHDVSAVFPIRERTSVARTLGMEVLPEEENLPLIIHQKLSVVLARDVFGVLDHEVLSAVGCHTTLKVRATTLDKVLFVADKIKWDHEGIPPYHDGLLAALEHSLDHAALFYLEYMWNRRHNLKVLHPWLKEAYCELFTQLEGAVPMA